MWWRCQEQGIQPLDNDLDLLVLCTPPSAAWPAWLSLSTSGMQNCLVAGEELSGFAEQGARVAVADVEAEWTENRVYHALRTAPSVIGGDGKKVDQMPVPQVHGNPAIVGWARTYSGQRPRS